GADQLLEALVGALGGSEAGEHAHRPQPPAMAGGVDAAGVGRLAGKAKVVPLMPAVRHIRLSLFSETVSRPISVGVVGRVIQVFRGVDAIDLDARLGDEPMPPLGRLLQRRSQALFLPLALVVSPSVKLAHA